MSKHTPGPWTIDTYPRTAINAGTKHIAMVNFYKSNGDADVFGQEHESNARLIAAAPDLLEVAIACREACLFVHDDGQIGVSEDAVIPTELFARLCAVIKKAKGDDRADT
jgi:hypothetical protein